MAAVSAAQLNVGTAGVSVKSVNVHAEHNNLVSCCSCILISQLKGKLICNKGV